MQKTCIQPIALLASRRAGDSSPSMKARLRADRRSRTQAEPVGVANATRCLVRQLLGLWPCVEQDKTDRECRLGAVFWSLLKAALRCAAVVGRRDGRWVMMTARRLSRHSCAPS